MTSVIIVGAGAAGLMAAKSLRGNGVSDVMVLEANTGIGGRLKRSNMVDYPIDLGGQWIHPIGGESVSEILDNLLDRSAPEVPFQTVRHDYSPIQVWDGAEFYNEPFFNPDHLFVNYTWFDFFNDNVATSDVMNSMQLSCAVDKINADASEGMVAVSCADGRSFNANHAIVTTSLKVIQDGLISFVPPLPSNVQSAISNFNLANAVKMFVEFSEKFYPDAFTEEDCYTASEGNSRFFWSESFGEQSTANVLGLFAIGPKARKYSDASSDDAALLSVVKNDIDQIFGEGTFDQNYVQHVVQDWSREQFVRTGYTVAVNNLEESMRILSSPIYNGTVLFAGESIPIDGENWGYAHGAAYSGRRAPRYVLNPDSVGPITSSARVGTKRALLLSLGFPLVLAGYYEILAQKSQRQ